MAAKNLKPPKTATVRAPAVPPSPPDVDLAWVRGLAEIATANGLAELKVRTARATVIVRRGGGAAAQHAGLPVMHVHAPPPTLAHTVAAVPVPPPEPPPVAAAASIPPAPPAAPADSDGHTVNVSSPFVGTFYRSPSPEAPYFVEVGQRVKKGQVLCIVEAMKLMNEIEAESEGKIGEVLVENGEHVEYGQHLFRLAKA